MTRQVRASAILALIALVAYGVFAPEDENTAASTPGLEEAAPRVTVSEAENRLPSYSLTWSPNADDFLSGKPFTPWIALPLDSFYVFLSPQRASSVTWDSDRGLRLYHDDGYPWRQTITVSRLGPGDHVLTVTVDGISTISVPFTLLGETATATTTTQAAPTAATVAPKPTTTTQPKTAPTAPKATTTTTTAPKATTTTQAANPVAGVVVRPGESIQAAVDSHPAGTTFVIKAGVHKRQSVIPKGGNTFVGEPGAVLSGENTTAYAFGAKAGNVTVRNLVIENYAGPKNEAAIMTLGGADGWRIEGNEIRYNKGSAIRSGGTGWHIVGNNLHHNEVYGMTGTGARMVIENNEIAFNNYQKTSGGSAGGSKWFYTQDLVVRGNYSHDNVGPGLWTDGHNEGVLYEGNRVVNNTRSGIKHEASCDAVIRNNTVEGNGFASGEWMAGGIRVSLSPDVEVHNNVVSNNLNGITAVYSHRDYADTLCPGPDGQHELKNLWVHDNTITMPTGQTGVVTNTAGDKVFGTWNNRFDRNTYVIGNTAKPFEWRGDATTAEWKAAGQDPNSTWK